MRLIDADAFKAYLRGALEQTRRCYPDGGEWAEAVTEEFCRDIDEQPSAQPEIIRCKDCKYRYLDGMIWNCPFGLSGGEDFFCAYGAFCPECGVDMRGGDSE